MCDLWLVLKKLDRLDCELGELKTIFANFVVANSDNLAAFENELQKQRNIAPILEEGSGGTLENSTPKMPRF